MSVDLLRGGRGLSGVEGDARGERRPVEGQGVGQAEAVLRQIGRSLGGVQQAVAAGWTVRLEQRPKNPRTALDALAEQGFTHFAVATGIDFAALEVKPLVQS